MFIKLRGTADTIVGLELPIAIRLIARNLEGIPHWSGIDYRYIYISQVRTESKIPTLHGRMVQPQEGS